MSTKNYLQPPQNDEAANTEMKILDEIKQIKRFAPCGALAQLGERLTGSQEVSSSILLCSTIFFA
jgi:hypothetical protein